MPTRVTMKEVAEKAGVSPSTVCRALGSNSRIPPVTRERIQRIAESIGYRPDPLLSAFALRRRGKMTGSEATTIAYITSFPTATGWMKIPFYRRCFHGAESRAAFLGYGLEHFWLKEQGMTGRRLSRILYNRGISGVCVAPTPRVRGHMPLDWSRFCSVTIAYSLLRPALHRVAPHHYHAMLVGIRELRRLGYNRIGLCLFTDTSKRVDDLWLAGLLLCRRQYPGIKLPVFFFDDKNSANIAAWCREEKLEAVLSDNNFTADQLKLGGIRIPGDVHFATLDWGEDYPEISGFDQRPDMVGATAVDMVIAQLQRGERGIPSVPITTLIEGRWVPASPSPFGHGDGGMPPRDP